MIIKRNETGIKHTPCYMQYGKVPTLQQYGYCWSGKRHCVEVVRSIAYNYLISARKFYYHENQRQRQGFFRESN
jgi:hypothetical protein